MTEKKRMMHKRGDGEGSIDQTPRGLWRGRLMVGYKLDGKPDRRVVYGKTRDEVRRKISDLRKRQEGGTLSEAAVDRVAVADFLTRWLEATKSTVLPKTWKRYEQYVRLHMTPTLGKSKLSALRPDALQRLYSAKLEAGLAPRTVHHIHTVLHTALAQAVRWGYAARNVADSVDPPTVPDTEMHPPTPTETTKLLDTVQGAGARLAPLWTLALYSGCRLGELLGLQWDDINLQKGALVVRRSLTGTSAGVPHYGAPKTKGSRRTMLLPPEAISSLQAHQARQAEEKSVFGPDYVAHNLVFASQTGTPLVARNVERDFKKALAKAGLPEHIRIHDLRHASATFLLAAGVPLNAVSERLGHASVSTTGDIYGHAVEGVDADAAAKLQQLLRGPK